MGCEKIVFKGKLSWVGKTANSDSWDVHWLKNNAYLLEKTKLPWYVKKALRGVSESAQILEAGCGSGFIVRALDEKGYQVSGVDNAQGTIDFLRKHFPVIDFCCQDLRSLQFSDNSFDVYISLGVIEHFEDESEAETMIKEAIRVTKPQGRLFFSVPFTNYLRQKKINSNEYRTVNSIKSYFYQRSYTLMQLKKFMEKFSFQLEFIIYYDAIEGITREMPFLNFLRTVSIMRNLTKVIDRYSSLLNPYSHMIGVRLINKK